MTNSIQQAFANAKYAPSAESQVICDYCQQPAELVSGNVIYPHRPDLKAKMFWRCIPCRAYVGCHAPNNGYGNGTRPLGRLANAALRAAKNKVHVFLDPLFLSKKMTRAGAYKWLAEQMGIPASECHVGMFSLERCDQAHRIL